MTAQSRTESGRTTADREGSRGTEWSTLSWLIPWPFWITFCHVYSRICSCRSERPDTSRLQLKQWYVFNGNPAQNYGVSLAIWDHTVLPATRNKRKHPALTPASEGWYSIYLPQRDGRLSWPRWLVTYRDGLPAHRQSPIQVLTGSGVQ